ncbi:hypothetical protein BC829DRAFT_14316 [Chytridium lagenaria]|nr:hypothetical protein BC829DRAFT_14316 [Chytridium lagenaria]
MERETENSDNDASIWEQFKSGVSNLIHAAAESFRQLSDRSSSGNEVWFLGKMYNGLKEEAFMEDFTTRLWMTYRHSYPPIKPSSFTADIGWGCMLRSGQMMLSNAFMMHLLGREWRLKQNLPAREMKLYVETISWFLDSNTSPYSIHRIALIGKQFGKEIGEWFGPSTISQVLKVLLQNHKESPLALHVVNDGVLYLDELKVTCEQRSDDGKRIWLPVLVLVPFRLGLDSLNPLYIPHVKFCFHSSFCIGIAGLV